MFTKSIVFTLLAAPALVACSALAGSSAGTSTDEADHTAGAPMAAPRAWLWVDETEDAFKARVVAARAPRAVAFLPGEHPITQRLQLWVDRIDAALRAAHPEALKVTPKPHVIVREDSQANAWVAGVPVAWRVPTRLAHPLERADAGADAGADAATPSAASAGTRQLVLEKNGKVSRAWAAPLVREMGPSELAELFELYNAGFAKCRLQLEAGEVVLGEGCAVDRTLTADRSDLLAFYASSNWVTVTTSFIRSLADEKLVVAWLAHELSHYYRAHSTQPSDLVNYFYALDEGEHAHKPPPDPRYLDATTRVREKLRDMSYYVEFSDENRLMVERRLGFYTTEQEADDMALEILTQIGLSPNLAADAVLHFLKLEVDGDAGEIPWAECSALRERGFKDAAGAWVAVPVGDLSTPHHSFCFRVLNITRELAAHAYVTTASPPEPTGEAWAALVSRLGEGND